MFGEQTFAQLRTGLTVGWAIGAAMKSSGMMALDKCYAAHHKSL